MTIEVKNDKIAINNFETDDPDLIVYFENLKQKNKNLEEELYNLLKLGVLAAKAGNVGLSTDYVDKQVEKMKEQVLVSLQEQFGNDGAVVNFLEEHLGVDGKIAKELLNPTVSGTPTNTMMVALLTELEKIKNKLNIRETEQKGTQKGFDFEDYCQPILESVAKVLGDTVDKTGDIQGLIDDKGDFEYTIKDLGSKIVLEMKDMESITLPYIKEQLDGGMTNRAAQYGIFVSKKREALPKYVGLFNEYDDNKLVIALGSELEDEIIHDDLIRVAIGWARSKLKQQTGQGSAIDTGKIRSKIQSVEEKMKNLTDVKTKCTGIENSTASIRSTVDTVQADIATDIKEILESMNV
jgi:hypothetical protein